MLIRSCSKGFNSGIYSTLVLNTSAIWMRVDSFTVFFHTLNDIHLLSGSYGILLKGTEHNLNLNLNVKKVYSTVNSFAHCTTAVSQVVRRPLLRRMRTACIRDTNEVRGYTNAVSLSIACLCFLALNIECENSVTGTNAFGKKILRIKFYPWITKQNIHAIADTKCQYFQTNLWLGQVYIHMNVCRVSCGGVSNMLLVLSITF